MDTKELRAEYATLLTESETLVKTAADAKRDFTADESTKFDANFARLEQIKATEDRSKKLAEAAYSRGEVDKPEIVVTPRQTRKDFDKAGLKRSLNQWFQTGDLSVLQQFTTDSNVITTATASGALLPKEVMDVLAPVALNSFREALLRYNISPMSTPTTADISLPVATASAGDAVGENTSNAGENPPSLTNSFLLHPTTYEAGITWISNQQLNAVQFDLFSELLPVMNYSKELAFESASFSAMSSDSNITQNSVTSTVSGFTYGNLVTLNRALPKRYDHVKAIFLNTAAFTAAENLTTSTGFPILAPDAQNMNLKSFNGTPVVRTDYLAGFSANNVVGVIVSLVGARLRDAGPIEIARTVNFPGRAGQTGYNVVGYHCWGYDFAAAAKLKCPAS